MYISSGGGSGKGSALPNQQSNPASTTPAAPHNAALQAPMYQPHIQSLVMSPAFHTQYMSRQPASQIYSSTTPIHFQPTQMPPNYSYFFTNSLISTQHRPSIIHSGVPHNPNPLALPGVSMVSSNLPPQASCPPPVHPQPSNSGPTKKRSHALPIINPITKKNILEEFELSKARGLDSKQQAKPPETEAVNKPSDICISLAQKQKSEPNSASEGSKETIIKETPTVEVDLQSKPTSNIELKEEKPLGAPNNDGATQDFCKNSNKNTETRREQPTTKKQDVDIQCSNLQNENLAKNQSSINHPIGEHIPKASAKIFQKKPICEKPVESCTSSQVNGASTKGPKIQSMNTAENNKKSVGRQRKKSHSSESVEKRISDNSKKKNFREEEMKKKDRVENKNVSTDINITRKSPKCEDAVDPSLPGSKEVKTLLPAKDELNTKTFGSDTKSDKTEEQKSESELLHSKEIREISIEISKESTKATLAKIHSGGSAEKSSLSQIVYKDGQWSPSNPQGKRVYDIAQLHLLSHLPLSNVKPKLRKANSILNDNPRTSTGTSRSYKNSQTFVNSGESCSLSNLQFGNKSTSKIGNNQTKQVSKPNKPGMIHVRLSLRENIKLSETENAWRPSHFKTSEGTSTAAREKEELFRKVRGILNKLTPEKFDSLVDEIMKLQIDTSEKINGVMMLVFEKAIDEPNFSASYARLCQRVADKNVQCDPEERMESKKTGSLVPFKTALLDKTEREFHDNVIDLQAKNDTLKPTVEELKRCTDVKKKQELQIILEEQEFLLRKRSCGTVRFIGELFKMSMLTGNIIRTCVYKLLDSRSEDKLECLCKLLTTVGKKFEQTPTGKEAIGQQCLDDVIRKMQGIVDRKMEGSKVSNRVRFMLQDVIDLRRNKWMSNHRSSSQKTLEPASSEQINANSAYNSSSSKRGERAYDNRSSNSDHSSRIKSISQHTSEETWFKNSKGSHMVDTNKLRPIFHTENPIKLGDSSQFMWRRDRASSTHTENKDHFSTQMPDSALKRTKTLESEETRFNAKKGMASSLPSIPKSNSQTNLQSSKTATLPKKIKSATMVTSSLSVCSKDILSTPTDISEKDNKLIIDVLNKMVDTAGEESIESCLVVWTDIPKSLHWALIYNVFTDYLHLRKTKLATRQALSKIVSHLMHKEYLQHEDFEKGYLEFSKIANEIVIDVPEAWKYIFEFIGHFILNKTMSIRLFWNQHLLDMGMGKQFLKSCFQYFITEMDSNYMRNLWQSEKFEWKEFLQENDISKFIEENKFQFLNSKDDLEIPSTSDLASRSRRIKEFLQDDNSTEKVMEYLNQSSTLVNDKFIKSLTLTLCESAVVQNHNNSIVNQTFFRKKCIPLLRRYIDSEEDRELRCLCTAAEFAKGFVDTDNLLGSIFCELFEADVISQDSFLKWWDTRRTFLDEYDPLLGLSRFFNSLNTEASDEN